MHELAGRVAGPFGPLGEFALAHPQVAEQAPVGRVGRAAAGVPGLKQPGEAGVGVVTFREEFPIAAGKLVQAAGG